MKDKWSCRKCEKRFPGCHSTCEAYKQEKIEYEKAKAKIDLENEIDAYMRTRKISAIRKAKRRKGKK